jgi:hypothetical protein
MLIVGPKLDKIEAGAGEPFIVSVQFRNADGDALDMTNRRVVMSFYKTSGRGLFAAIDGVPAGPGVLEFIRPGTFTESLYGQGLTVSLSERLLSGRETLATGTVKIAATADPVESYGPLIGRAEVRLTVQLDDLGAVLRWGELIRRPYANDGAPVITTPASISSDPTPEVGETFTLVRPTGNGPVVAERLLENGVDVFDQVVDLKFTARVAGTLRYEAGIQGPDGNVATSGSTITVASAAVTAPTKVGDLPHKYFTVGTGPQTFSVAGGFAGTGLVYSVRSAHPDAVYALNASTGAMVVQTNAPSSGDVVIRAANSAGFVEQTFPLFVVAVAEYTVLAREANGTVTVESIAVPPALSLTRNSDGSVTVQESAQ